MPCIFLSNEELDLLDKPMDLSLILKFPAGRPKWVSLVKFFGDLKLKGLNHLYEHKPSVRYQGKGCQWKLSHIWRESNAAADYIATRGLSSPDLVIDFQAHLSGPLKGITRLDKIGLPSLKPEGVQDHRAVFELLSRTSNCANMHPPLTLHRHSMCIEIIELFQKCHADHPIGKFFGECTELKIKLDRCFREEKALRRKANFEESKKLKERLKVYRKVMEEKGSE